MSGLSVRGIFKALFFLLLFAAFVLPVQPAQAQSNLVRYWVEGQLTYNPDSYVLNARDSVTFQFSPHQELCEGMYGQDWFSICGRSTGMSGQTATGFALIPDHPGRWTWDGDMAVRFTPSEAWPADVNYQVSLSGAMPSDTMLMTNLTFRSGPIMASGSADFKYDPNDLQTMAVSGALTFNYPMDRDSVAQRLQTEVVAGEQTASFLISPPSLSWSSDNRMLYFSVPVHNLPASTGILRVSLLPGAVAQSGGVTHDVTELNINVSGADGLFSLTDASMLNEVGADMAARQLLALEFTLPVKNAQVLEQVEVLLLPRQRVNSENADSLEPYRWWSTEEITPEILQISTPLALISQNDPDFSSMLQSFAFAEELEPGRSLLVTVPQGLSGQDGYALRQSATFLVQTPGLNNELKIMQNGGVLALTGDRALSLYSRNLDRIAYEVVQIRPEFINLFVSGNYGSFERPWLWNVDLSQLGGATRGEIPVPRKDSLSPQFSSLDLGQFLNSGRKGLFRLALTGYQGENYRAEDQRFVLLTDLGLLHKVQSDNSSLVLAVSLAEQQPVAGARIQVLGGNGLPVAEGVSDSQGRVDLPDLRGLPPEKKPVAILASLGEDLAFLPWENSERQLDYSRFEVGGNYSRDGLSAFVFTQRDMYRPGENIYFGYLLKQTGFEQAGLAGLPLRAEVHDSRGNLFAWDNFSLDEQAFGELTYSLPETAPTGSYTFDLLLGPDRDSGIYLASQDFRVEEFQPDTLRLTVRISPSPERGWLRPADLAEGLTVQANLQNLFGAPALGNSLSASAQAEAMSFRFSAWRGWNFYNAAPLPDSRRQDLESLTSDELGDANWLVPTEIYAGFSSVLTVRVEGFDPAGGRSVQTSASVLVSPLDYVMGWRSGSYLHYLRQNSAAQVEFQAVDNSLRGVAVDDLSLETVAVTYVRTLIKDDRGQYRYDNLRRETVISSVPFSLPQNGRAVDLELGAPGQYMLAVRAADGKLVCRVDYTVAGDAVASFDADREPALSVVLDKEDYLPGEEVEIWLSAPYAGAGLITVEAEKVEALAWFRAEAGDSIQRIRLPENFEGKAYLNVAYFRNLADPDIFSKPLAAAVQPFTVNMGGRDLTLSLEPLPGQADKVVRPGSVYPVEVKANRAAKVIVFAVDEGILQLTNYRTPDPLGYLLGNRALQVGTYQYLDLLMPEYGLLHGYLSAFGGGEDMNFAALGQNPFRRPGEKSAVFWSGLVETGPDGTMVEVEVPPYFNGQMRIMAVACAEDAVGAASSDVLVQAEVVIQPSLPLFATPGDLFSATLTLTDMSGYAPDFGTGSGRRVRIEALAGPGLELASELPEYVELFNGRQQSLTLNFRVLDVLGGTTITFAVEPEAGQPGERVTRPLGLSLRPANPLVSKVVMGRLALLADGSFSQDVPLDRDLYPQFAGLSVSVSSLPLPAAHGFMNYLGKYPYGCTEQLISQAFPALLLLRFPELAPHGEAYTRDALSSLVSSTLTTLARRHDGYGNFAAWPGYWGYDIFLNAYAADFLLTAESVGVAVPYDLKYQAMNCLRDLAAQLPVNMVQARDQAYAAWVLTRNGELTTNILASLTAWMDRYNPGWEADIAAVFMAGCWQLMMQPAEAERLLAGFDPNRVDWGGDLFFNNLSSRAFYLSVLAAHFPDKLSTENTERVLNEIMELAASRGYMSTSAAQSARALLLYSRSLPVDQAGIEITGLDRQGAVMDALPLNGQGGALLSASLQAAESGDPYLSALGGLSITGSAQAYWQVESTGFDRNLPQVPDFQGLEIRREFRNLDGSAADAIRQGDELVVALIARVTGSPRSDIAIVDLLPAGFELILSAGGEAVQAATSQGRISSDTDMLVQYVERREDRVLLFPELTTDDQVFRYRVRVSGQGQFTLPPVYGEAMYDPAIRAVGAAGQINIQ